MIWIEERKDNYGKRRKVNKFRLSVWILINGGINVWLLFKSCLFFILILKCLY